jgi:hypothetical protein
MITTRVKLISSDSVIWNKDMFLFELMQAATNGNVIIDLNQEGPCCESLGVNALIDLLVRKYGFNYSQFSLENIGNQLCSSKLKESKTNFVGDWVLQFKDRSKLCSDTSLQKRFGIFIGRSNWIRLGLASYLWQHHRDETLITFHYNNKLDFHKANFGLEEFVQRYYDEKTNVMKFLEFLPITADPITTYPIIAGNFNNTSLTESMVTLYKDLFCEIACETYFSGKTFHLTEKTLRPMLYKKPFIIQGPKYFIKNLKLLGFKTFDQWWDEGYDQDHHDSRYETVTNNIEWIASQTPATIANWYKEMQPILEHNYNTALNLTNNQILTTKFYYE